MDANELRDVNIWGRIDAQMEENNKGGKRASLSAKGWSLRPTEASVVSIENDYAVLWGSCHRKTWYRILNFKETEPITTKTLYIFKFGNIIEDFITDMIKEAGIHKDNSVRLIDSETNINGEIDIIVGVNTDKDNDKYVIVEVKSTWGGPAMKLFPHYEGRGNNKHMVGPKPKEQNLLQLLIYLFKKKDDPNLIGGKLIYLLRDNFKRTEFDVVIEKQPNGKHRARVDGTILDNFYIEDIYDRYEIIHNRLETDLQALKDGAKKTDLIPPERDFDLEYREQQVESLHDIKRISDTNYNKYNKNPKGNPVGDWQCSYCSFKTLCYAQEDLLNTRS